VKTTIVLMQIPGRDSQSGWSGTGASPGWLKQASDQWLVRKSLGFSFEVVGGL
jgi:hypothetical protein